MSTDAAPPPIVVPQGYSLYTENKSHILLPAGNEAFLNPVQEFNRDLSVACIRTWSEVFADEKQERWLSKRRKREARDEGRSAKKKKTKHTAGEPEPTNLEALDVSMDEPQIVLDENAEPPTEVIEMQEDSEVVDNLAPPVDGADSKAVQPDSALKDPFNSYKFTLLEALSATGLRSIRYAKEIPLIKYVIANDLSPSAVDAMRKNVEINGLGPAPPPTLASALVDGVQSTTPAEPPMPSPVDDKGKGKELARPNPNVLLGTVRVNEGDARALMYNHTDPNKRVDVVDLDPYGTAAPFIDAAVQCVSDGGLLCVTCTDMGVLAGSNYMEKCYANYGGVPAKAEYCHEVALRLVLHSISTAAARYGRYIQPLLSLSIDFYVRLFVRINTSALEVKRAASNTAIYYVCSGCQAFHAQPLGKIVEKTREGSEHVNLLYKTSAGPPVGQDCDECGSKLHVAGPMWAGPLHEKTFSAKLLEHVNESEARYGTWQRMKGMVTVAHEELDSPFYFTPSTISGLFHTMCPSLNETASALMSAGHAVSRSHASAGSIKTDASRAVIHDVFRSWIKKHPVHMDKVKDGSPTARLIKKPLAKEYSFDMHPNVTAKFTGIKLVRYPPNPAKNWGPGTKAQSNGKRKQGEVNV